MHEARCAICERELDEGYSETSNIEYTLIFHNTVCRLCGLTLSRGFAGIVEMLRQAHGEKRERVLSRIMDNLNTNGFSTIDSFPLPRERRA